MLKPLLGVKLDDLTKGKPGTAYVKPLLAVKFDDMTEGLPGTDIC